MIFRSVKIVCMIYNNHGYISSCCCVVLVAYLCLFATLWTVAHQAPLSMEFSRQEHWSGLPFPSPNDLPDPEIESRSPALQADSLPSEMLGKSIFHHTLVQIHSTYKSKNEL